MKLNLLLFSFTFLSLYSISQCEVFTSASQYEIFCGESVSLTAFGQSNGTVVLSEDFNTGGFGAGWGSTPGSTSFSNPCSPGGVDGTPHAWMDNNTTVPRTLQSASYDLSAATAGVTICFDLLFASQGDASPCEGPDEPDEGVYLEYSIDGGATWIQITYFDPNGGNDPQLTNWNNWCFQVPAAAITPNTMFRWHQTADSGADYDHWGIDNVEIYQNDISAELEWIHDGYSYGVGNPGGTNPTDVTPTSTTTYTAQFTTGGGIVCTQDVTIVVLDPVYDVNVTLAPTTICQGDCADFTGDASWVIDPGGIETYENNQLEIVATGSASVNINIQDLNMTTVDPGSIQEICINGFNFSGTELCTNLFGGCNCNGTQINFGDNCNIDASSFNITVTSPNGCVITLVPSGELTTTGIQDMCFVPAGGAPLISGSGNYTGQFDPTDPISNLDGCDANGVWTLEFNTGTGGFGFGFGSLTGWNITFDDPPVVQPVNTVWSPTTGLTDPNSLNTQACPNTTTTYTLEVDNGVPGCATYTEDFTLTVDPCGGCIPPVLDLDPIFVCSPNNADLNDAINPTSDPAAITFHGTQADAQNDVNPISNSTGATGSYWVRAEDPLDPTCFEVYEIQVTVTTVAYNANVTDENCGNLDGEIDLVPNGGVAPYTFSIDNGATFQPNGTFTNLSAGIYTVVIIDDNGCEATGTANIANIGGPSIATIDILDPSCAGLCDGEITVTINGGTLPYTYQWLDQFMNPVGTNSNTISALCAGDYSIEVTDAAGGACPASASMNLTDPLNDDPSFDFVGFCEGGLNAPSSIVTPGGTFSFDPVPLDGAVIDATTGEISNGVGGTSYSVVYTTPGACPQQATVIVDVIPGPTFTLSQVNPGCGTADGEIIISDLTPNTNYELTYVENGTTQGPANFTSDAGGSIILSGLSAGNFSDFLVDLNGCSTFDNSVLNLVNANAPSITAPADISICVGESVTLTALNPDNALINWDNGVSDDVPFSPGVGTIIYTVSADLNGCIATDQVIVTVNALPVVNAGADIGICEGDDLTLSGNGANSYVWNNGVVDGVAFTPGVTATFTVIGTDVNGCVGQDDVTVTVNELPTVDFVGDPRSGCAPLLVDFRNLSGANNASCTWELGDGTTIVGCDDFSHVYQNEGNYSITLTVESNEGCTNSLTFLNYINVTGPPEALFSADPQVTDISNTFVNFTNESTGGVDFTWDFGDGSDNEFGYNASHEFPNENSGTYVVTLIASEGTDCADTARLVIQINDVLIFYVPNTFTPDDDPFNPIFIPVFGSGLDESDYELIIFNRWGEVVFETRDVYEGWDGTYKGQPVKDGTYVWKLEFLETMSDKRHSYHGHVNVLR